MSRESIVPDERTTLDNDCTGAPSLARQGWGTASIADGDLDDGSNSVGHTREAIVVRTTWGQHFLFALFAITASLLFSAALLLPIVGGLSRLRAEERAMRDQVEHLRQQRIELDDLAIALREDPDVNERLARLELGYTRPGEEIVLIRPSPPVIPLPDRTAEASAPTNAVLPRDWPAWTLRAESFALQRGWVQPLMRPQLRRTWMLLSGGLLIAAYVLFAPRKKRVPATGATN